MDQIIIFLEAITPVISIVLPAYLAYRFGLLKSRNEIITKRKIEVTEELGTLIQTVIENNVHSVWFYTHTFSKMGLDEAIERIERHKALYLPELERISAGEEPIAAVREKVKIANLYLSKANLDPIREYLELQSFFFESDVMGERNYLETYFENLLDAEKRARREILENKIINNLNRLTI